MPPKKTTTTTTKKATTNGKVAAAGSNKSTGTGTTKPAAKKAPTAKPAAKDKKAKPPAEKEATEKMADLKMVEGIEIGLKDMIEVINNNNEKVKESNRWPLLVDKTEQVSSFLRHRDCNYLDVLDKEHMTGERIRLAILGGIRYGKPMVLDLMGSDVWNLVENGFKEVQDELLDSVLDQSILQEEKYTSLIDKENDRPEYTEPYNYVPDMTAKFVFVILTTNYDNMPDKVKSKTITVTVS